MQNETLSGNASAAARGAIARDVRLCVACLHENRGGEGSCEACGTSLFLILCGTCEAANGAGDLRCHACGAALGTESSDKPAEPAVAVSQTSLPQTEASDKPEAAPPAGPRGPARTEASDEPETVPLAARMSLVRTEARDNRAAAPPARGMSGGRLALMLAGVVVTTAAVTYYFSVRTAKADRAPQSGGMEVAPAKQPKAGAPAGGPTASVGSAAQARPADPGVTHTRPADASQAAPVKSVEAPGRVPTPRMEPKAVSPAVVPTASVGSAPEARPAFAGVTHTRPTDASETTPSAAVARVAPDAGQKSEPGCDEVVVALGLCNTRAKSGGQ